MLMLSFFRPAGWRLTKTSPIHAPSTVSPAYIAMWAPDQKLSISTVLLWIHPSQKTANSVTQAKTTVTRSSHGSVCGRFFACRICRAVSLKSAERIVLVIQSPFRLQTDARHPAGAHLQVVPGL